MELSSQRATSDTRLEAGATNHRDHVLHRLAHAIYGLIVLVAVVGELRLHDDRIDTAIALVASGALVLVVAHSYSQLVATAAMTSGIPARSAVFKTLVDQSALALPALVSLGVLLMARAGAFTPATAYGLIIAGSLVTLVGLGVAIGRHRGHNRRVAVLFGLANLAVGLAVVGVEAAMGH